MKHTKMMGMGLCLCILVSYAALPAGATDSVKVYPLPIAEVEEELFHWLEYSGFEVQSTVAERGEIKLGASRGRERWLILLRQRSPLATELKAAYTLDDRSVESRLEELWEHMTEYIEGSQFDIQRTDQSIPTAVLSQIGTVVCVTAMVGEEEFQFSGFAIDENGLIVCTAHDLKSVDSLTVTLYDGLKVEGRAVKVDPHRDLALVQVSKKMDNFVSLVKGRDLVGIGERLYSIGCPINLRGTVHSGIVNGPPRRVKDLLLWQIDMRIYPGSSGSPVFDVQGNLVAIVKGRFRGTYSVGFLIPFETIMEFVEKRPVE